MAKRPASRPSSIDRLDAKTKALIRHLRLDEGWTLDEILERLMELGKPVSRSALGRHTRSIEEIGLIAREAQATADAMKDLSDGERGEVLAEVNNQVLQSIIFRTQMARMENEGVEMDADEALALSRALSALSSSRKTDADRRRKDREEAQKEFMTGVEKLAEVEGSGLTSKIVTNIRAFVLGGAG